MFLWLIVGSWRLQLSCVLSVGVLSTAGLVLRGSGHTHVGLLNVNYGVVVRFFLFLKKYCVSTVYILANKLGLNLLKRCAFCHLPRARIRIHRPCFCGTHTWCGSCFPLVVIVAFYIIHAALSVVTDSFSGNGYDDDK